MMERRQDGKKTPGSAPGSGLAGWLLDRLRSTRRPRPRLALLERIALAPRQSLALVEAEGRRFTASITTSIGMFQLPPVVVSTPLKILLFVMVDGWNLLANSLLKSF